jgi:hypothetical protein
MVSATVLQYAAIYPGLRCQDDRTENEGQVPPKVFRVEVMGFEPTASTLRT